MHEPQRKARRFAGLFRAQKPMTTRRWKESDGSLADVFVDGFGDQIDLVLRQLHRMAAQFSLASCGLRTPISAVVT